VVTSTGKSAIVEQGREIPYSSSSGNAGTNVQFKKAVVSLTATPFITPDDRVQMDLVVTQDEQGENVAQTGGGFVPAIDTRKVQTSLLVDNGATVVLGGVYQDNNTHSADKVPLLGDVPFIGSLFRHKVLSDHKRELLIFVTPKIIKEGLKVP
jgi:type IV pilus assembly protein PilQ